MSDEEYGRKICKIIRILFRTRSLKTSLAIIVDKDDQSSREYSSIRNVGIHVRPGNANLTKTINKLAISCAENCKYLMLIDDDFVFETNWWDANLIQTISNNGGCGISYGDDLLAGKNMPTTSVISSEIILALGWIKMPTLKHLYGDNVWKFLGEKCGCLYYFPGVVIEHEHYFSKKCHADEICKITNSKAMYEHDESAFLSWIKNNSSEDILKVKKILEIQRTLQHDR